MKSFDECKNTCPDWDRAIGLAFRGDVTADTIDDFRAACLTGYCTGCIHKDDIYKNTCDECLRGDDLAFTFEDGDLLAGVVAETRDKYELADDWEMWKEENYPWNN